MFRAALFVIVGVSLLLGAYDATNFNALERKHQPPPSGHVVGKDNGVGEGLHFAGEDCGVCHYAGGKAGNVLFTMSGTIYEDRLARRPAVGAEVILQDIEGNVLSMTTNKVGNFWTTTRIASNPNAVSSHGGTTHTLYEQTDAGFVPADPEDTRTWQYKAWIQNDNATRHMVTVAPVGGATSPVSRMSCNMHHASMGFSGAAWVSSKPTLGGYPESNISFRQHVLPVLSAKCVPCHIPGKRATRLVTASDIRDQNATSFDYSDGKDFTSYGGSTVDGETKEGFRAMVDPADPDLSEALAKTRKRTDGTVNHGGGGFWTPDDADYKLIRQWVAEGARDN
ncbi:MAG: hypothetical protein AB2A00_05025 [Myxococcota bacterium]